MLTNTKLPFGNNAIARRWTHRTAIVGEILNRLHGATTIPRYTLSSLKSYINKLAGEKDPFQIEIKKKSFIRYWPRKGKGFCCQVGGKIWKF